MLGIRKENVTLEVMVQFKQIDGHIDGHFFFDESLHEGMCANGGLDPDIHNLGTRCFTSWPL